MYAWISSHKNTYSIVRMCKFLKVSKSGYYKHLNKKPSATEQKRKILAFHAKCFTDVQTASTATERLYEDFTNELPDISCSMDTVRKIMHDKELFSCVKNKYRHIAGDAVNLFEYPNNRLNRNYKCFVNESQMGRRYNSNQN